MLVAGTGAGAGAAGALKVELTADTVSFNGEGCLLAGVLVPSLDIDDDWIEFVDVTISLPLFEMTESRGFGLMSTAVTAAVVLLFTELAVDATTFVLLLLMVATRRDA